MAVVAVVAALALIQYAYFGFKVGQARGLYNVPAPATSGHATFERLHRVHQNTLENLALFLPGLWLFAHYVSAPVASALGVVFIVGRAVYAQRYVADPTTRGPGVLISFGSNVILVLGGLAGAAWSAF